MKSVDRLRDWIDAKDRRPIIAAITIVEVPIVAGLWVTTGFLGAPWWVMPTTIGCAMLVVGWVFLVVAALGGGR